MKKIFVAVLAMAGVVACNTVDTLDVPQNPEIRFANAFVENATRANEALDPSTTTESLTAFDVWGFMDNTAGTVFVGEDVTGSEGNFTYTNTQYWAPGHTYYFAAVAPMNSTNVEVDTDTADLTGIGTIKFTNENGTEDLLYSAVAVDAPALGEAKTVMLTFNHLLSKVKFTFTNGFANDNAYIDVKKVTMTAPKTATATLTGNWWEANPWAGHADETILEFGDACSKTPAGETQVAADERLTIPASAEQKYTVTFEVALYMGDVVAYSGTKTATIEGVALEIGKAYNFSATLNASNITEDGTELQPIVFDVEEVKDWVEAGEQTGVISGAVENMTLLADAQATETVNLTGVLDGAGHTISAVDGVDYVKESTARLIEAAAGSTVQNLVIDGKGVYTDKYGIRGIYTIGTGDVTVKNVEILNCTYAINANNAGKITVLNSTLQGWNSYGSTTEAYFENVKFIDGEFHNFRPYNNTVCKNCDFGAGVVIDLSCMVDGATIKFVNCTVDGVPMTAANLSDAEGVDVAIDLVVTEAPESNALVSTSASNMTIDGGNYKTTDGKGLRGIYLNGAEGTFTFDNVVVKNVAYAINVNTTKNVTLNVSNSTLEGWTSYGNTTTATFTNVKFECGNYYGTDNKNYSSNDNGLFRPYGETLCEGCSFEAGFYIDLGSLSGKLTLKNCTYNGEVITEENVESLVCFDNYDAAKLAF